MAAEWQPLSTRIADVQGEILGREEWCGVPQPNTGHGVIPALGTGSARIQLPTGASGARVAGGTLLLSRKGAARSFLLRAVDSRTPDTPQENGWPLG